MDASPQAEPIWADALRELEQRRQLVLEQGGADSVARQHANGRLTIRERIAQLCDYPTTCPHGQPIDMEAPDYSVRLSTLDANEEARVSRIGDEEPEFLFYVDELGLRPGVHLTSLGRAPFNGPFLIRVGDREHALGDEVVTEIWVERLGPAPASRTPSEASEPAPAA